MNGLPPSRLSMDGFAPPPPPPASSSSAPRITLFSSRVNATASSNGSGNDNANGNGSSSRVQTMQREDTSDSGSESDGDPPGFVGQAPPPPIAPRPVLPKRESSSGGGSNSSSGGPLVPKQQQQPARSFEELEDITFSSPRSFLAMAFQIAQARGVDLLVDRDNTDTAFRYMHVVCPYRHTGPCPFILKLRAPIEGGWIVTGPPPAGAPQDRATGLNDARGPSTFECKHPPRAMPRDFRPGETVARWLERDTIWARGSTELAEKRDVRRASTPQAQAASSRPGSATKSSSSGRMLRSSATDGLKQVDSVAGKAPRFPRSAHHVNHSPLNGGGGRNGGRDSTASPVAARASAAPASPRTSMAGQSPIQSIPAPSRPAAAMDTDRALAPPFQRALDLQAQIAPALGHGAAAGTTTTSLAVNGSAPSSSSRPIGANPYPPMTFALPPPAQASGASAATLSTATGTAPASLAANGSVVSGTAPPPAPATGSSGFAPPPPPRPGSASSSSERRPGARPPSAATSALPPPPALAPPVFPFLRPAANPASWGVSPPCIAKSTSYAIDEWTTFLRDYLGEPSLVPLARVLGSAYMSVKPAEFFSPSRGDDDLRRATLEAIPVEAVGVWPRLRLIKAMRERGQAAWDRMEAEAEAAASKGDSTMHGV
ncbi:hypothetical protein C6P46_000749 [Rhodotorula mucilaginosa]|uniref:Uncharacterized protein n=1 Tax=Rhodotorula mucilaginosa TaxID=5537 RepID=A0A9P6VU14_RHOMI|nr:hypothetical protein C6P46_000749 [Rhodotorula mucilaginosa]